MLHVTIFRKCDEVPQKFDTAFADVRSGNLFRTRPWLEAYARAGIDAGTRFRIYAIASDGAPLALLPAIVSRLYHVHRRARVLHFIQPEGEPYVPLAPSESPDMAAILYGLLECIGQEPRPCDVIRVSPLDPASPFARQLQLKLRGRRYPFQAFRHLDDRYEMTGGMSSHAYLAARPVAVKEALRTTVQPFFDNGRARFRSICDGSGLDAAIEAYTAVLERNRRELEAEPGGFARNIMRVAAAAGALRVGVIDFDNAPAAVQLWIVSAGIARCIRIWNDPGHGALPLDDMLVQCMAPQLLDVDQVHELDFGSIENNFAQSWAPRSRQRIGIVAFNPRTWRGVKGALRHILLPKLLATPRRVRRKLLGRSA